MIHFDISPIQNFIYLKVTNKDDFSIKLISRVHQIHGPYNRFQKKKSNADRKGLLKIEVVKGALIHLAIRGSIMHATVCLQFTMMTIAA